MIEGIIINVLIIHGIFAITREDYILGFVQSLFMIKSDVKDSKDMFKDKLFDLTINYLNTFDNNGITKEKSNYDFYSRAIYLAKQEEENSKHYLIEKLRTFLYYLSKPIFNCTVCMSSIWGVIFFYLFISKDLITQDLLLHVLAVAGLSFIVGVLASKEP